MTSKEIRDLSADEITAKVRASREELLQLRLRKQFSQMESLLSQMRAQGDRLSSALANGVYSS